MTYLHGTLPLELFYLLPHLESLSLPNNSYSGAGFQAWRESHPGIDPHRVNCVHEPKTQALLEQYPELVEKFDVLGQLEGFFELAENQQLGFNQSMPTEVGLLTKLNALVLDNNNLRMSLPSEIAELNQLQILQAPFNNFEGNVPSELVMMSSLQDLDLSENHLNGTLPTELGLMASLQQLDLNENDLTGTIPFKLCEKGGSGFSGCSNTLCGCEWCQCPALTVSQSPTLSFPSTIMPTIPGPPSISPSAPP